MNDTIIDDLKQFIATTVHQDIGVIENRLDKIEATMATMATKADLAAVELKIDNLTDEIGDSFSGLIESTDEQLNDHDKRIAKLEHKAA